MSGIASFLLYVTSREALFPCFVILANGGDNYINYKHFANMKGTIYGNRLSRGMQVKRSWEPVILYILESNPHLVFADFLNKKKLVHASNPHLSFNRPLPTRQADWIILDVIRIMRHVWSGHLTASSTNAPQLISVAAI